MFSLGFRTRSIPHWGHLPAPVRFTCGCMGQVHMPNGVRANSEPGVGDVAVTVPVLGMDAVAGANGGVSRFVLRQPVDITNRVASITIMIGHEFLWVDMHSSL